MSINTTTFVIARYAVIALLIAGFVLLAFAFHATNRQTNIKKTICMSEAGKTDPRCVGYFAYPENPAE